MEMQYFKDYSPALGRDMECKIYGHAGRPMLYIPCQDGRFFDFEDFHMADTLAPWIESGQIMVQKTSVIVTVWEFELAIWSIHCVCQEILMKFTLLFYYQLQIN